MLGVYPTKCQLIFCKVELMGRRRQTKTSVASVVDLPIATLNESTVVSIDETTDGSIDEGINELLQLDINLLANEATRSELIKQIQPKIIETKKQILDHMTKLHNQLFKLSKHTEALAKAGFNYEDPESKEFIDEVLDLSIETSRIGSETYLVPAPYAEGHYGDVLPCEFAEDGHYDCDQIGEIGALINVNEENFYHQLRTNYYTVFCKKCCEANKKFIIERCALKYVAMKNPYYFRRGNPIYKANPIYDLQ